MKTITLILLYLLLSGKVFGQDRNDTTSRSACIDCGKAPCRTSPSAHFSATGIVRDSKTGKPIKGAIVTKVGSDGSVVAIKTDSMGNYFFDSTQVHRCTNYIISADDKERHYLAFQTKATISTIGLTDSKIFIEDFALEKPIICQFFPRLNFKYGSTDALGSLPDTLDYAVKFLNTNPNLTLEFDGHGSPDEKNAQALSLARAIVCKNYLISKGIDSNRVFAKGWGIKATLPGCSKTDIDNMKTRAEKIAACEADRRVEFRVLSFQYNASSSKSQ